MPAPDGMAFSRPSTEALASFGLLEGLQSVAPEALDKAVGALDGDVKAVLLDVSDAAFIAQALEEAMEVSSARQLDWEPTRQRDFAGV